MRIDVVVVLVAMIAVILEGHICYCSETDVKAWPCRCLATLLEVSAGLRRLQASRPPGERFSLVRASSSFNKLREKRRSGRMMMMTLHYC